MPSRSHLECLQNDQFSCLFACVCQKASSEEEPEDAESVLNAVCAEILKNADEKFFVLVII